MKQAVALQGQIMSVAQQLDETLAQIRADGLWKSERVLTGAQGAWVQVQEADALGGTPREVLNLCANNYLGLADNPRLIEAAVEALQTHGLGMASVRFICGTSDLHRVLEKRLAKFLGQEDAILYPACFDANGGLFEPLLGAEDAIVSDSLNHASIIDGIRLCKAARFRYANCDMQDLEQQLKQAREGGAVRLWIATDGVFSMDGSFAPLAEIRALADKYKAWVMVDDCHAAGFIGAQGAGTPARAGVRVEVVSGTLGKALGGSAGGYIAASQAVIDLLRQRSRPYLFSNSLPPAVVAAALAALDLVESQEGEALRTRLMHLGLHWRKALESAGFSLLAGAHPIVPVMLGESHKATDLAEALWRRGVYVTAFSFPVVPRGQARIRTQMSAALTDADLDFAAEAFIQAGTEVGVL